MRQVRNAYEFLWENPEKRRPFRKLRHLWEDNIKNILVDYCVRVWTAFDWLKLGSNGIFRQVVKHPLIL
jgi:hypothetical protein